MSTANPKPVARARILVVEDEAYVRDSLAAMLRARGFTVDVAEDTDAGVAVLGKAPVDAVLTDLKMPGGGGLEVVKRAQAIVPDVPVVVLTGFGTVASAVECLRAGATDYILKPTDPDALEVALERALERRALRREVTYLRSAESGYDKAALGESDAWRRIVAAVEAAAPTDGVVLLRGESGTGKEMLARMVHRHSHRASGPFVRVSCGGVPEDAWDSELFGHRKGTSPLALSDREGRFRLAHGGTLFMDEVSALPLVAQAKLLRVLEEGQFERLGDDRPTAVDVRLVASTNADLEAEVAAGRFRQDLYYRLNVLRLEVPPLRDRAGDLPLLARRFVEETARRLGRAAPTIAPSVLVEMNAYGWPGNVRELRNVIERVMILNPQPVLSGLDLAPAQADPTAGGDPDAAGSSTDLNLRTLLGRREREIVIEALRRSEGVRKEAARLLGIDQRNLGYYLRKHDLDADRPPSA
jgi:DNA-binding NtrC family response regulator